MRLKVPLLVIVLCLGACADVQYTPTRSAPVYEAYTGPVAVLWQFPADGEYQQLGVIKVEGGAPSTERSLLSALKKKAAKHGANAIVVQSKLRSRKTMDGTLREMAAYAIRRRE